MSCVPEYDLCVIQGATFTQTLRWETQPVVYKSISGMPSKAPVRLTVPAHGVPDGWRVAVLGIKGPEELNAKNNPPGADDYYKATVIDANTIELNSVNAINLDDYVSGGVLQYNSPVDLTGYTARMQIRKTVGSTDIIKELTTANGGIVVDNTTKTINITISATDTAAFSFSSAVYALEMVSSTGVVTQLLTGRVTLAKEVTR